MEQSPPLTMMDFFPETLDRARLSDAGAWLRLGEIPFGISGQGLLKALTVPYDMEFGCFDIKPLLDLLACQPEIPGPETRVSGL
jgi:hypothetical protein